LHVFKNALLTFFSAVANKITPARSMLVNTAVLCTSSLSLLL